MGQERSQPLRRDLGLGSVHAPEHERCSAATGELALCDSWLACHEREVLPGGCFLTTATIEFDARPGPLRDAVASVMKRWLGVLEREVLLAVDAGELPPDTEPADVAFPLNSLAAAASYGFLLWRNPEVFGRARRRCGGRSTLEKR